MSLLKPARDRRTKNFPLVVHGDDAERFDRLRAAARASGREIDLSAGLRPALLKLMAEAERELGLAPAGGVGGRGAAPPPGPQSHPRPPAAEGAAAAATPPPAAPPASAAA